MIQSDHNENALGPRNVEESRIHHRNVIVTMPMDDLVYEVEKR